MATTNKREQGGKVSWQVRYRDANGKERSKQFAKHRDAEAFRIKVESEVKAGVHTPESTSATVARAADLFLEGRKLRELERSSIASLDGHIENHIKPFLGSEKLATLTMPAVNDFAENLVRTGRSRVMAAKVLVTLRSILRDAMRRGLVAQNVAIGVTVPVSSRIAEEETVYVPTKKELRDLLAKAETDFPKFYPLVLTAVFTGLRSSELRGLRIADIDLKGATISVKQRADFWGVIGAPKSKAGRRTIPIPPMLVSVLRAWILQAPKSDLGLAFPAPKGGVQLHSNMEKRLYIPLLAAAGLADPTGKTDKRGKEKFAPRFGIHCLRHAAASAWIKGQVDLKRVQTWLGHSTIELTMDRYGHLIPDAEADAAIARASERALFG